jgi:outer membrane protein assembly complex protein YaeT
MIASAFIATAIALADTGPALVDQPIAQVNIVSVDGAPSDTSLHPLLHTIQGEPFNLANVRSDLNTLMHVGEFSSVSADVQDWFITDEAGRVTPAVLLTYIVMPAPRVSKVHIQGLRNLSGADAIAATGLSPGSIFYPEVQGIEAQERVLRWLDMHGYPRSVVELDALPSHQGQEIWLRIDEGNPRTLTALTFKGDSPVPTRTLLSWAKEANVRVGKPVNQSDLIGLQRTIQEKLATLSRFGFGNGGRLRARVNLLPVTATGSGSIAATILIDAGPRLVLDIKGMGLLGGKRQVLDALDIHARTRITRGFIDAAPARLTKYLQERGYLEAQVTVDLASSDTEDKLIVRVNKGKKFAITEISFTGEEHQTATELRAVMKQASPEGLRRGIFTDSAISIATHAITQRYKSTGHQGASIQQLPYTTGARTIGSSKIPKPRDLFSMLMGNRLIQLHFQIDEGPRTHFSSAKLAHNDTQLELAPVTQELESLSGTPYSPQTVSALSGRLTEQARDAGYLDATVSSQTLARSDGDMDLSMTLSTGPQVLLRSFTVKGNRKLSTDIIKRNVDLKLGQAISTRDLSEMRQSLYSLDSFRELDIRLLGNGTARDLLLTVQERAKWGFELGGGANTDQGMRVWARATRRHLFGRPQRLALYGFVGADWLGEDLTDWTLDIPNPEWRTTLAYTAPQLPFSNQLVEVELILREEIHESLWQMSRSALGLSLDTKISKKSSLRLGTWLEQRQIQDVDAGIFLSGEEWLDTLSTDNLDLPSAWRFQPSLNVLAIRDNRNDQLDPTSGSIVSLMSEWVPGSVLSSATGLNRPTSLKGELRASNFLQVKGVNFRTSLDLGYNHAFGDGVISFEDRFRLGGTGSLRGYNHESVGPHNETSPVDVNWPSALTPIVDATNSNSPTRWVATGGDTKATFVAEMLVPLPLLGLDEWEGYSWAFFVDSGNVWNVNPLAQASSESDIYPTLRDTLLRYSVGTGVRVTTPIGPLQFDLAGNPDYIFSNESRQQLLKSAFDETPYRMHLSLGALW